MLNTGVHHDQANSCDYTKLNNGIHRFVIKSGTRAAADQFIVHLERVFVDYANTPYQHIVVDASAGTLPIVYVVRKVQQSIRRHPQRPAIMCATLIDHSFVSMIDTMVALLRTKDRMRYFKPHQYNEAIEWLLSVDVGHLTDSGKPQH